MNRLKYFLCLVPLMALGADTTTPLLMDWWPTNAPQEQVEIYHSPSLAVPLTSWQLVSTVPGYIAIPPQQPTWSLSLIYSDATGTNWFGVFYASNTTAMVTSVVTHIKSVTVTVSSGPTNHFFAARSLSGGERSPFSEVTGDWYPTPMRLRMP